MGEIADMMLDGTLCECCGVYLGSDNDYPTKCADCASDNNEVQVVIPKKKKKKNRNWRRIPCPACSKHVKKKGLSMHMKDVHGIETNVEPEAGAFNIPY